MQKSKAFKNLAGKGKLRKRNYRYAALIFGLVVLAVLADIGYKKLPFTHNEREVSAYATPAAQPAETVEDTKIAAAQAALENKRYILAATLFEEVLASKPSLQKKVSQDYVRALQGQTTEVIEEDTGAAQKLLLRALEIDSRNISCLSQLAYIYMDRKDYPQAIETSADAKRKNSDVYFLHTSRWSWETLGVVADWYTGDSSNWKKLAEINPDVNAQKIVAGSEIFIPVKLLKTREALPQNYAANYCKKCYRHTVHWPGESMSLIARWYTGASDNWRKLAEANPSINPNLIKKGNVILIPPALLKTREPLPQKVAARYTANYFAHTVKEDGEKMEMIASWYTGKAANWKIIARANPKLDPNSLVAGNKIYIPSELLKTRQPISNSQTAPTAETPNSKPSTVDKTTPPVEKEEIKIFGPKQFPKS